MRKMYMGILFNQLWMFCWQHGQNHLTLYKKAKIHIYKGTSLQTIIREGHSTDLSIH